MRMQSLSLTLDATDADHPLDYYEDNLPRGVLVSAGAIPDGTENGLPAVVFVAQMEDGSKIVVSTTLALIRGAVGAMAARYPDPRP